MTFKIGDIVRCVEPSVINGLELGKLYTVRADRPDDDCYLLGFDSSWRNDRFELFVEQPQIDKKLWEIIVRIIYLAFDAADTCNNAVERTRALARLEERLIDLEDYDLNGVAAP